MNCNPVFLLLVFARHFMWSHVNSDGGTTTYYYDDEITWLLSAVAVFLVSWFLLSRYLRARRLRRPASPVDRKSLRRAIRIKQELSSHYLRPGFSQRIHAIGIGLLEPARQYCIQIFIDDGAEELWSGAGNATMPSIYGGVPLVLVKMRRAVFIDATETGTSVTEHYPNAIRERCEVIVGGISGANAHLTGQSGTIGYFCTRRSKLRRSNQVLLLANSHTLADLQKGTVDEQDLILQPSPGEPGSSRPIATLIDFSAIEFENAEKPNTIDAALAKLWHTQRHDALIPGIGSVKRYVRKQDVNVGEPVRKTGRTTGYSVGWVCSIYVDIWISYSRTGRSAFFHDQILVEPDASKFSVFVDKGDSGSLLVDAGQNALGLIFAGVADATEWAGPEKQIGASETTDASLESAKRIEGYGVANPIAEVLDRMKIDLLVD